MTGVAESTGINPGKGLIAVLPVYNLSGTPAPLKEIRQRLIDRFKTQGLNILDEPLLQRVIAKHRIRYIGGVDLPTAKAFREEADVAAILVLSLELSSQRPPPKLALTSRLVSTEQNLSILWMDGVGLSGDESPGLLGLSRIDDPDDLMQKAAELLSRSFSGQVNGRGYPIRNPLKRKTFWPRVSYRSPILDSESKYRVAVVPFFNLSERKYADEIMALHFVNQLRAFDNIEVIEPGAVRETLLRSRVIMDDGLSLAHADLLFRGLGADLILMGRILDYQDYEGTTGNAKVEFLAQIIERKSREVVWSSRSYGEGDDSIFFFDLGKVYTAHTMASEMVLHVARMIFQ